MQLRKRIYELKRSNSAKDRLFSIIGHDLRGMINNIPAAIDVFRDETSTIEEKEFMLNSIEGNALASAETLDGLLNWGKSQLKGLFTRQLCFNAVNTISNELKLVEIPAQQKNITAINWVPKEVQILADIDHFRFIIRNLISNAIKFSKIGGTIEINADENTQPGFVLFSVKDNGIGIEKEKESQIFEPFNNSIAGTANETGNSIGLMLCKEYVIENGGRIWVESKKSEGSTFHFTMKSFDHDNPAKISV
ncbi:HAMP domain-containing histidine kinase [Mucilaginibacter sp. HMF5004]|uniref:sensor histidine kinase n=1 Tax=Mucilaginibacter rivuli TaxID=2857527 RepID=UPI001C5D213D|nr:HAMP domain-containing sensor histidine kinase [Mucilaginibacter rivuli]MBW4888931.1 HAMP domain-containing histidine kinase [Mucilaginibacter rivuli]